MKNSRILKKSLLTVLLLQLSVMPEMTLASESRLSLEMAVRLAQENDGWLKGSKLRESSLQDEAAAKGELPDPVVSIGLANLPVSSLEHDQENMTQLKIGYTQYFPRGDSLELMAKKSLLKAGVSPFQRAERLAKLRQRVSELWLDSFLAWKSIALIENERQLFEQLVEVTNSRYTSTAGRARQQDVVRAQLELTRLDDRLTRLKMLAETNQSLLSEWLPETWHNKPLSSELPEIEILSLSGEMQGSEFISQHPAMKIIDQQINIEETEIMLARQQYKPGLAVNTAYAFRDDSPEGMERDDFISVGVSFDLPMFTANRQDKQVSAATKRKQAATTDYLLMQKTLAARLQNNRAKLSRLEERAELYKNRLLKQMHEQAEAALAAYTNDNGDFAEVMRAYIAELNSKIEALEIGVEKQKAIAEINYLLAGMATADANSAGDSHE